MNNVDVLNIISDFLNFEDFMYNFSLISKDFKLEKRNLLFRKKCANSINDILTSNIYYLDFAKHIFCFSEEYMDIKIALSNFMNKLKNDLLNYMPFEIFQFRLNRYIIAKKYVYSNSLSSQYITAYVKVHSVYRCSRIQYSNISNNLNVKALIY